MNAHLRRFVLLGTAGLFAFAAGLAPAHAANDHASCVGIFVSTEAPAGNLDVASYKVEAEMAGAPNFGQFVAAAAQRHAKTFEKCLQE